MSAKTGARIGLSLFLMASWACSTQIPEPEPSGEEQVLSLIGSKQPFSKVPEELFEELGWNLPDGGQNVKALADSAPGGAFKPEALEEISPEALGYRAKWHVIRFPFYGLDWDITGLHLTPVDPIENLPTVAYVHGGSANWYEFFLDPLNGPGLGQYLAQRIPVLLITIPGNYKPGGWSAPYAERAPAYLLDQDLPLQETALRNAILTFSLICDGVARLVEETVPGPLLITGHSTGGEIQFLLKERLADQLRSYSLGWATGGPARLRYQWEQERGSGGSRRYPPLTQVRGRSPEGYTNGYVGPLNPLSGGADIEVATRWFEKEGRRRPKFKQPIQDLEHRGEIGQRQQIENEIREVVQLSGQEVDTEAVMADLFSTMEASLGGYRKMIWTVAAEDDGHWDPDPGQARELYLAEQFRKANPEADIRVLVYDLPMTHYGHIEKPRQLAGGTLAAVKWLYQNK